MLTQNAKNFLIYGLMNSAVITDAEPYPASTFTLTNTTGQILTTGSNAKLIPKGFINALNYMAKAPTTGATYIKCGTGTTEPTENDHDLEAEAAGLSCDSAVTAVGSNGKKSYTATFSNATDTDITITEIGFFVNDYYNDDYGRDNFLLDHIILDTPITIPSGESKAITYEIGF